MTPDPARVARLEQTLIDLGVDASLAGQIAHDILVFHPEGGSIRMVDGAIQVIQGNKKPR